MNRRRWIAGSLVAMLLVLAYLLTSTSRPPSARAFDPERVANLELRMWQAYYGKQRVTLFRLLVTMLREQNGYSWAAATRQGFYFARAAATFGDATSGYERVLPDLEAGYEIARKNLGARFDSASLARAELSWWVARRTPGQNDPRQVGERMADAWSQLYEVPRDRVIEAARLRAEAGAMRDAQAAQPDWPAIEQRLRASYWSLRNGLDR